MMSRSVDIHFRVEGDDPRIQTLHETLHTSLERGWSQPFCKGALMSDGQPSPTNFTSIVIGEDIQDTPDARAANPLIQDWLTTNRDIIGNLKSNSRQIQVATYLPPNAAYEGFFFDTRTMALAVQMECGLEVMTYRLIKD